MHGLGAFGDFIRGARVVWGVRAGVGDAALFHLHARRVARVAYVCGRDERGGMWVR